MAIEIMDLPIKNCDFPCYVSLPQGIPSKMVIYILIDAENNHQHSSSMKLLGVLYFHTNPKCTYQNKFLINRNGHIETNQFIFVTVNLRLAMGKHFHFTGQVGTCTLSQLGGPPALVGEERDSPDAL